MKLAERIRRARRQANLSQAALAEYVGVQRSAVSNWEANGGGAQPTMVNLLAIATACNVAIEWLGTGRGPSHLGHDASMDIPAADADLGELPAERELLKLFRSANQRSQGLVIDLLTELGCKRLRDAKPAKA